MHDVRVALHLHEPVDLHGAGPRHTANVVAPQVDEHHMLRPFLQVAEKLFLEAQIFWPIRASTSRSGEGPCLDSPTLDLHQLLGRRTDHVPVAAEREENMYGDGLIARRQR